MLLRSGAHALGVVDRASHSFLALVLQYLKILHYSLFDNNNTALLWPAPTSARSRASVETMDDSLLATLPVELRNMIYRFAFTHSTPFKLLADSIWSSQLCLTPDVQQQRRTALLLTCKQVRTESIDIFYSTETFMVDTRCPEEFDILPINFLHSLSLQDRRQLRNFSIRYEGIPTSYHDPGYAPEVCRRLFRSMLELLRQARSLPGCRVQYLFHLDILSPALSYQLLPPCLTIDARDLSETWQRQKDGLLNQSKKWMTTPADIHKQWARYILAVIDIFDTWMVELKKIADGRFDDVVLSNL